MTEPWFHSNKGAGQVISLRETEEPRGKNSNKQTASESLELVQRVPGTKQVPVTATWAEVCGG